MQTLDRRRFLRAGGGALLAGATLPWLAAACGSGSPSASGPITLQLSNDKASWLPFFTKEGDAQRKANKISWRMNEYSDTNTYQAAIRTSGSSSKVPDLYTWWSGYLMQDIVKAGFAANVNSLWDKNGSAYSSSLRKAFTFNGVTYGAPLYFGYWATLYNTEVFDRYNLKPPQTWSDFTELLSTLKGHGVTPLGATINGVWPGFIYFEELMIRMNPDLYQRLCAGKAKYTDSGVLEVMKVWGDLIKAGYFTNPSSTQIGTGNDTFIPAFKQGKVAMLQIGTWYEATMIAAGLKPGRDYKGFIWPNRSSGVGNHVIFESGPMVVAEHGAHRADAIRSLDWFMSKAGQQEWNRITGFTSARTDVPSTSSVDIALEATVKSGGYKLLNRYWEATPNQIANAACNEFDKFMLNPSDPAAILAAIQPQAAQVWSQNGG